MAFEWTVDVADGVLKNHALSSKLREASIAKAKLIQFVETEPGYGKQKGDSITITRIKNIAEPTSAVLNERDRIPIDSFSQSSVTLTVKEYGRSVQYTHKSELLAHYAVGDKIQKQLRRQMTLVLDVAAATAFKTAKVIYIPTSVSGGVFDTDGTPSTTALANASVNHYKVIRDYMADTLHVPGWNGGDEYVCLASVKNCRGIRNDPEFMAWRQYIDPEGAFYRGEIGKIENIRFVEVDHTTALANNKGSGSVLGESLVFGDDAVAMAVAEDPELRAAIPGDYGRQRGVAWYGVLEFGLIWDTANDGEARVIRMTSA